jgi:release factor glutamine methyltransferase
LYFGVKIAAKIGIIPANYWPKKQLIIFSLANNINLFAKQQQCSLLLQNIYPKDEADSIVQYVFTEVLKLSPLQLRMNKDEVLKPMEAEAIDMVMKRLLTHEPVQYILGVAYFYGLRLVVHPGVLIPRRETEELVALIVKQNAVTAPRMLDMGTGSGCIAIALKHCVPSAEVFAIDASEAAVRLARQNALSLLQRDKEKKFLQRDIFDTTWWNELGSFDVIVSNPPYVTEREKVEMQPNVLKFEPAEALFVPDTDPLRYYSTIADFSLLNLRANGKLYFEINEQFGAETKEMLENKGFAAVEVYADMQGKQRMISAVKR